MNNPLRTLMAAIALALLGVLAIPVAAQAQQVGGQMGGLTGWLHLSTRVLSLSGGSNAEGKYAEDFDYQRGFQLVGLALEGRRGAQEFGLNASGWGEEPTATLGGWLKRPGLYRLTFGGHNARYFHTTGSYVDDFGLEATPFAYTRRGRYADLALNLGKLPDVHIRYDRFRRVGSNNLVWNIEQEKRVALSPVDETSTSFQIATSLPIAVAVVDLSYTLYHLDNRYGAVVPDTSEGLDNRPSVLYDYSHIVHDEGSLPVLKAGVAAPVGPALIRFGYSSSAGTVDKVLDEREVGIDNLGSAIDTAFSRSGKLDRSFSIIDAGVSLPLLTGIYTDISLRQTDYEISGTWDPTGSDTEVATAVSTTRYVGRVIWNPMRGVSVDLGGASINRKFEEDGVVESETITTDWVGGFTYSRQSWFRLRFSHRVGDIESPYTRLSPTDRSSLRTTLSVMPLQWLTAIFSYQSGSATRYYSHDSSDPEYYFNTRTSDVRNGTIGLRVENFPAVRGLNGEITYTRGRLEMTIPVARFAPPSPPVFDYRDLTHAVTGGLNYEPKEGLALIAEGFWYQSRGQWPLTRFMGRLGVAKGIGSFTVHLDYRMFSMDQVVYNMDDYEASLFTLGVSRGF